MKNLFLMLLSVIGFISCQSQSSPEKTVERFTAAMLNLDIQTAATYCTSEMAALISNADLNEIETRDGKYESFAERCKFLSNKKQMITRSSNVPSDVVQVFVYFYDTNNDERVGLWMFRLQQDNSIWKIYRMKCK
jgi:hypothetical protein